MKTYSIPMDECLNMPISRFWFLVNQMDRIIAEENLAMLTLLAAHVRGESLKDMHESLVQTVGTVYVTAKELPTEFKIDPKTGLDPSFDRQGLASLRDIAGQKIGETV